MLVGDTGLTLETDAEAGGHRPSRGMLAGVAPSARLPPAHPARRRCRAGKTGARPAWPAGCSAGSAGGQLPYLPGVGAARLGLAVGMEQLALPRLLARLAGSVVIPGRGAQREQGAANITPSVTKPAPPLGPLTPTLARQDSRCPGSSSGLTRHCSPSPAGPPGASAPRRRGRRRTARARAPGTLGHTTAPPRSLGGLSAQHQPGPPRCPPALPRAHQRTPLRPRGLLGSPRPVREPSAAHPAPLPRDHGSSECGL